MSGQYRILEVPKNIRSFHTAFGMMGTLVMVKLYIDDMQNGRLKALSPLTAVSR